MLEPPTENLRQHAKHPINSRSHWDDAIWNWDDTNPTTASNRKKMRWDFTMRDGTRFSEPQWAPWAEAMKIALWSLMVDPPADRRPLRISTLQNVYRTLIILVKWMHDNGYERLNQLTRRGQREFMRGRRRRKGRGKNAKPLQPNTLAYYQNLLQTLFLQGSRYPQLAIEEPAPQDAIIVSTRNGEITPFPRTPEAVATVLIGGAIRLLGSPAQDIIEARDQLFELYREAHNRRGRGWNAEYVRQRLKDNPLAWRRSRNESWYAEMQDEVLEVPELTKRLCDAAFVVLCYLVGMRVSEILGLEAGCITKRPSLAGDETFTFVIGKIYKTAPTAKGQAHEWIAPPIVERAIDVLEQISRPLRERSGKRSLWLTCRKNGIHKNGGRITPPNNGSHRLAAEREIRALHWAPGARGAAMAPYYPSGPENVCLPRGQAGTAQGSMR